MLVQRATCRYPCLGGTCARYGAKHVTKWCASSSCLAHCACHISAAPVLVLRLISLLCRLPFPHSYPLCILLTVDADDRAASMGWTVCRLSISHAAASVHY